MTTELSVTQQQEIVNENHLNQMQKKGAEETGICHKVKDEDNAIRVYSKAALLRTFKSHGKEVAIFGLRILSSEKSKQKYKLAIAAEAVEVDATGQFTDDKGNVFKLCEKNSKLLLHSPTPENYINKNNRIEANKLAEINDHAFAMGSHGVETA